MKHIPYVNDGTDRSPRLEHHLNLFSIAGKNSMFDSPSIGWKGMHQQDYDRIKRDGFAGLQSHIMLSPSAEKSKQANLNRSAAGIVNINNLRSKATKWQAQGYSCATIMIGSGNESKRESLDIAETVFSISQDLNFPIYLELHRATVTQDIKTVLHMIKAIPGLKFNGDFSHYILTYRWIETFSAHTLKMISPILDRIAYLHLRPANSEHIQLAVNSQKVLALYQTLLQTCFTRFIANAKAGDVLIAAPELLPKITGYSDLTRSHTGHKDTVNRYQQCLKLKHLSQQWFNDCAHRQPDTKVLDKRLNHTGTQSLLYPIVDIHDVSDWQQLKNPKFQFANLIRIALGEDLQAQHQHQALIQSYLFQQQKDPRICLETCRNTITHTLANTLALQAQHPNIKLSLNIAEWVLGEEITVGQLSATRKQLGLLQNIVATYNAFATAEHAYDKPIEYDTKAKFSPAVLTERLYTRFYTKVWDKISAHRIDDEFQSNEEIAHQAILYARQQYQKA